MIPTSSATLVVTPQFRNSLDALNHTDVIHAYLELVQDAPSLPPRSTYFCVNCGAGPVDDGWSPQKALKRCTGCHRSWYCSKECQKDNWILHKLECNASTISETVAGKFNYSSLSRDVGRIRLLGVLPGSFGSSLRCELFEANLQTGSTPYEALSYTWDSDDDNVCIVLNGRRFMVRRNLHNALQYLRDSHHRRIIWVDAVCINQNDNREKASQIRQMGQIYSSAQQVLMWIGEATYDSDVAIDSLQEMAHSDYKRMMLKPELAMKFGKLFIDDLAVNLALSRFGILRPYWQRVWIVQEVMLAQNATIVCGQRRFAWNCLVHATKNLKDYHSFTLDRISKIMLTWKHVSSLVSMFQQIEYTPSILSYIRHSENRECWDNRDRVHAFLSLPCREDTSSFTIDYALSTEEIYTRFAIWHIKQTNSLDVLSYAFPSMERSLLNSWVPDWTRLCNVIPLIMTDHAFRTQISNYNAGANLTLSKSFFDDLNASAGDLATFAGSAVDRVKMIAPSFDITGEATQPNSAVMRKCISMMQSISRQKYPYKSNPIEKSNFSYVAHEGYQGAIRGKPNRAYTRTFQYPRDCTAEDIKIIEAFWRTLVGDVIRYPVLPIPFDTSSAEERIIEDISGSMRPNRNFWPIWQYWYEQYQGHRFVEAASSIFADMVTASAVGRSFMITEKGYMGVVGPDTEAGDLVVVLIGSSLPQVLRKLNMKAYNYGKKWKGECDVYQRRGDCYLHGVMRGEILDSFPKELTKEHIFTLI